MKMILTLITAISVFFGVVMIVAIVVYAIQNESGHTGANPYWALAVFVPVAISGIVHVLLSRKLGAHIWLGMLSTVVGCMGVGLLVYLDQSNTLLQYEEWIYRGMP